jgi:hypothetical protein
VFDTGGRPQISLSTDRPFTPRLVRATAPDGTEIGTVGTKMNNGRVSILADGVVAGFVLRPPRARGNWLAGGRQWGRFPLLDAGEREVGRVMHQQRGGGCNVTEVDQRTTQAYRTLALAASVVVGYWTKPTDGGG